MWQKISRSASCLTDRGRQSASVGSNGNDYDSRTSRQHHSESNRNSRLYPQRTVGSSVDDLRLHGVPAGPAVGSIDCAVDKPSVVGRTSFHSSRSTTVDSNTNLAVEESAEPPLATSSSEGVSDKVVNRKLSQLVNNSFKVSVGEKIEISHVHSHVPVDVIRITSQVITTEVGDDSSSSMCSARWLPQYRTLPIVTGEANGSLYWKSSQWMEVLERAARTASEDTVFRHVQMSEYRASIKSPDRSVTVSSRWSKLMGEGDIQITSDSDESCGYRKWTKRIDESTDSDDLSSSSSLESSSFRSSDSTGRECQCPHSTDRLCVDSIAAANGQRSAIKLREQLSLLLATSSSSADSSCDQQRTEERSSARGVAGISAVTRLSIVGWMGKVIESMNWPLTAYFIAVHAMDYTLHKESLKHHHGHHDHHNHDHHQSGYGIPLLSTACVLVGVSAECEHKQLGKAKCFVGQVPHVTNVRDIICKELSVVAGLTDGSLLHKTAPDFCFYYAARMRSFDGIISGKEGTFQSLFQELCCSNFVLKENDTELTTTIITPHINSSLLGYLLIPRHHQAKRPILPEPTNLLSVIIEISLAVSQSMTANSLHATIPLSRIVAAIFFHLITIIAPGMSCGGVCSHFCRHAFLLDYDTEIAVLIPSLFLMYENCINTIHVERSQPNTSTISAHAGFNKCSRPALIVMKNLLLGKYVHKFPRTTSSPHRN